MTIFIHVHASEVLIPLHNAILISIHFDIIETLLILVLSLADEEYELNERNEIVASIANITITTISSTRVKAE